MKGVFNMAVSRKIDVYLYGMTVLSTIHRLRDPYPEADNYGEIERSFVVPGGETGNAAILLARLGLRVRPEGPYMGSETREILLRFNRKWGMDCSGMKTDTSFEGWRDVVLVDGLHRTVFGWFGRHFSKKGGHKWSQPDKAVIQGASVASIDPYFGAESEKAVRLCREAGKPYVTLDCPFDSSLHRFSAVNVLSQEFLKRHYPKKGEKTLMAFYKERSQGLTVFTFGSRPLWYARQGQPLRRFTPYRVKVSGTLGAGDSFRAGMVYGLWRKWDDEKSVRFAAGLAACVCRKFPAAIYPPKLQEVFQLTGKIG